MKIYLYNGKVIQIPGATGAVDTNGTLVVYLNGKMVGQVNSSEFAYWFSLSDDNGIDFLGA